MHPIMAGPTKGDPVSLIKEFVPNPTGRMVNVARPLVAGCCPGQELTERVSLQELDPLYGIRPEPCP